jgi:hypothetical protein
MVEKVVYRTVVGVRGLVPPGDRQGKGRTMSRTFWWNHAAGRAIAGRRRCGLAAAAAVAVAMLSVGASAAQAGTPPALGFSPSSGTFGPVGAGSTTSAETFTLMNSGGSATGALTISLSGPGAAAFTITSDTCSATSLGPKKRCAVMVTYTATSSGNSDTATLTATGKKWSASTTLPLQGTPLTVTGPLTCKQIPNQVAANGKPYSLDVAAFFAGGVAPITYIVGGLPIELAFDPVTDLITGTPTTSAVYNLVVTAFDADTGFCAVAFSITVS